MYLPPNGASNASFLETLRLMLVHETRDQNGAPLGLELAFATPRGWLRPGRTISIRDLPTSFGPISYAIESLSSSVRVSIDIPSRAPLRSLSLRLRLPRGDRIVHVKAGNRLFPRSSHHSNTFDLSGLAGRVHLVARVGRL